IEYVRAVFSHLGYPLYLLSIARRLEVPLRSGVAPGGPPVRSGSTSIHVRWTARPSSLQTPISAPRQLLLRSARSQRCVWLAAGNDDARSTATRLSKTRQCRGPCGDRQEAGVT